MALSEEQVEESARKGSKPDDDPEPHTRGEPAGSWRWRIFSIGAVMGLVFGAIYLGVPTITGALLDAPIEILPIPFVDYTQKTSEFMPAVATGISLNLGRVIFGMVLPFWAVVGSFVGLLVTFVANPGSLRPVDHRLVGRPDPLVVEPRRQHAGDLLQEPGRLLLLLLRGRRHRYRPDGLLVGLPGLRQRPARGPRTRRQRDPPARNSPTCPKAAATSARGSSSWSTYSRLCSTSACRAGCYSSPTARFSCRSCWSCASTPSSTPRSSATSRHGSRASPARCSTSPSSARRRLSSRATTASPCGSCPSRCTTTGR